ncbi:hypothetical protein TI05_16135 [Achromatium sp. WMS3]|nr:hypothetical protein TI05_16135 [Achromatium sp. WMS3]
MRHLLSILFNINLLNCSFWIHQWKRTIDYNEKEQMLVGKGTKSKLLVAYIQGLMDRQKQQFNRLILNKIDSRCRKNRQKTIADVIEP